MKTKTLRKNKVNVVTLGCSKNIFDSEVMMAQLRANKFDVEHESMNDDAEIVIINTCGFIDAAKQESIDTIIRYAEAKADGMVDKVYVTGCLSERYRDELEVEIPEVDAFFGTRELPRLLKTLKADYKHELVGERLLTTPNHYAYFKIAEGCDRPCSFCAIPLMRGKNVSTPIEELVKQAKDLAAKGVKELMLIAQDLTYYGLDLYKKRALAELLEQLAQVEGIEWIRLHYAFPAGFPMDVLDVMNKYDNICKYLDMPLQHGSTNILKAMRRGTTREKTEELVAQIREKVPGITIRTTLIAGYPGETEADFQEMYDFVESSRFDRLGIFTYSHEENTHAYNFEDDVPEEEKRRRADAIMELQSGISYELNQQKVGKIYKVLFDRVEGDYFIGRTEFDSPEVDNEVLVKKSEDYVRIGDFALVEITSADHYDLYGKVIG
ncbi:30S ribosomal protein S12 methylthiotransferase RimO [Crocinitomicaceae bacterium CZZ-1]|uniref:Ribosomal protein uS12 methylthiotransferase RimO n=1 Tax=Taishania pollutisoli TaxID=2766479 RepID=A0A8J6U299_9FLAO|nr:30S ribosomal protein S12 methylthiotransferase RimO [Taishania pollutisoli]MBC9812535.1 30S ribosomal protein S12 methylthiotransferase RimO [Taishania pollutisoli]MBX2949432.1 30S ribosomal protein S12 methylthiotransferase RimO [Crocinitomicaceae bacterium]NGF74511.1 30S ribosomal protein S12 methylthiotransferase RimO [Fluviicola sp. SGL-29]